MEMVIAYMRRIERNMYIKAYSENLYFELCSEKITELQGMGKTRKRMLLQLIESYECSTLQPELDRGAFPQDVVRISVTPEVSVVSAERHFPIENLKDTEDVEERRSHYSGCTA
ncbi:uncharacterized protein LOC123473880 [Daphnia magna]|uniref:uncharacterized protein LOC123473880 n=1 Tax=Daphnia magna TaxID=35525 RepID=UPI001E1BD61F|nr:uncharacterized protein LOC123473880 [Daphnia magna]